MNFSHAMQGRARRSLQAGLSLVEMMVALAVGLVVVGAAAAVLVSNQQSNRSKNDLDKSLDGYRFGAYAVSRLVRQSERVDGTSTASALIVNVPAGTENCNGVVVTAPAGELNAITVSNGALVCSAAGATAKTLVPGVYAASFLYGRDTDGDRRVAEDPNANGLSSDSEYTVPNAGGSWSATAWSAVSSVKVLLTMANGSGKPGVEESFVVTLRTALLASVAPTPNAPGVKDTDKEGDKDGDKDTEKDEDKDKDKDGSDKDSDQEDPKNDKDSDNKDSDSDSKKDKKG